MAKRTTKIIISDTRIKQELQVEGKPVAVWRDGFARDVKVRARVTAPVNKVGNALHRASGGGGRRRSFGPVKVGTYAAGFEINKRGSNSHHSRARIYNKTDHAKYVELGRKASSKDQYFSWVRAVHNKEGDTYEFTGSRRGYHILEKAFDSVVRRRRL